MLYEVIHLILLAGIEAMGRTFHRRCRSSDGDIQRFHPVRQANVESGYTGREKLAQEKLLKVSSSCPEGWPHTAT